MLILKYFYEISCQPTFSWTVLGKSFKMGVDHKIDYWYPLCFTLDAVFTVTWGLINIFKMAHFTLYGPIYNCWAI